MKIAFIFYDEVVVDKRNDEDKTQANQTTISSNISDESLGSFAASLMRIDTRSKLEKS